jgi:transcription elongation GreA/GreB family factor
MDRNALLAALAKELGFLLDNARAAARLAHDTATHEENIAENKYDTLGLEAAYLAHGQTERVAQCELDLAAYQNLPTPQPSKGISIGSVVILADDDGNERRVLLGPAAGGVKFVYEDKSYLTITLSAPLGAALIGRCQGDDIGLDIAGRRYSYEIYAIF